MLRRWVTHLLKHHTYKFRQWIDLEDRKLVIAGASDKKDSQFPQLVLKFLSDALPIPKRLWERVYWEDVLDSYLRVASALPIRRYLPIISLTPENKNTQKPIWDYEGRNWFFYANLIAGKYGWTIQEIADLDAFTGMALIEEILLTHQLEREFQWSMSEASISYDEKTKTAKPNPLPRPYWMKQSRPDDPLPIPRFKIDKDKMPLGVVNYDAISEDYQPKEVDPYRNVGTAPSADAGQSHR